MKKYIYLDDEDNATIQPIIDELNRSERIGVSRAPLDKNESLDVLFGRLKRMKCDGIIIDYKLDGGGPYSLCCNANTIAQYLRDLADNGEYSSIPIVLCSTDENLQKQYSNGYTSIDLYDYQFTKDISIEYDREAAMLESLAEGYEMIRNYRHDVQKIVNRDITNLDERPFRPFFEEQISVQKCADVIIKDLFQFSGILISEEILCARLGIAKSDDYLRVLAMFNMAKYTGAFCEKGDYYWMDIVDEMFYSMFKTNLATLDSTKKIEMFKNTLVGASIIEAQGDEYNFSKRFWTCCVVSHVALDPMEGYRLDTIPVLKPWQEPQYVSFSAISEGNVNNNNLMISDYERYKQKVEYLKNVGK